MSLNLVDNTLNAGEPLKEGFDKVNAAILAINQLHPTGARPIGVLNEDINGENRTSILVDIDVKMQSGIEYFIVNVSELSVDDFDLGIYPFIVQSTDSNGDPINPDDIDYEDAQKVYLPGEISIPIQDQFINAPEGSLIFKSDSQGLADDEFFEEVTTGVVREKDGDSIGRIVNTIGFNGFPDGSTRVNLVLDKIDDSIELTDGQVLTIIGQNGLSENVTVNGDQTLTAGSDSLDIVGKVFTHYYAEKSAWIKESGYLVSSRLNQSASLIDGNATAIASLETHTNIGGGSAFSALTLKSRTDTNENDIDVNASAILTAEASIDNLQIDAGHVFRQTAEPTVRPSGEALVEGDLWIDTDDNDKQYYYTGSAWVTADATASLNLDSRVTTVDGKVTNIEAKAALVVDAGGTIGSIELSADGLTGFSEIDIQASQVTINGVTFDDEGAMYSDNFLTGTPSGAITSGAITSNGSLGWAIDRNGKAVFNDVVERNGTYTNPINENFRLKTTYETPPGPATFDDYVISNKGVLFISPTGGTITLTGITALNDGSVLTIVNKGNSNLVLNNEDTSSLAANRIVTPTGANYTIPTEGGAFIIYDGNSSLWRFIATT